MFSPNSCWKENMFLPRLGSEGHEGILWNNSYMNDFINRLIEKLRNNSILQIEALWGQWTLRVPSKIYLSLRWSKGGTDFGRIFVVWQYKKSTLQTISHMARVLSLHLTWTRGPCIAHFSCPVTDFVTYWRAQVD